MENIKYKVRRLHGLKRGEAKMQGEGDAQRPILRGNKPKKMGARSSAKSNNSNC
jgi:hypothetical protein